MKSQAYHKKYHPNRRFFRAHRADEFHPKAQRGIQAEDLKNTKTISGEMSVETRKSEPLNKKTKTRERFAAPHYANWHERYSVQPGFLQHNLG